MDAEALRSVADGVSLNLDTVADAEISNVITALRQVAKPLWLIKDGCKAA
jgi:hypothetical protein